MTKILITGYQHSGTTMLMQLLRNHPQVGWIEDEQNYITYDKPKEWIMSFAINKVPNLKEQAWGEKIPFGNLESDYKAIRPINFTKRWLEFFGKNARVLHIIRHPIDVASSGIADGKPSIKTIESIKDSLPLYIDFLNTINKNTATVVYENLVQNPLEYFPKILNFISLDSSSKVVNKTINCKKYKFGKINSERAYAFEKYDYKDYKINYIGVLKDIKNIIL